MLLASAPAPPDASRGGPDRGVLGREGDLKGCHGERRAAMGIAAHMTDHDPSDKNIPGHEPETTDSPLAAWSALRHWPALGAIAGLCFFGLLASMYDEFYREFGITSADVGMSYSDTLTRSWGFIITVAASLALGVTATLFVCKLILKCNDQRDRRIDQLPGWAYFIALCIIFGILIIAGLIGEHFMQNAGERGADVRAVDALRVKGLMFFDVRAQPVTEIVAVTEPPTVIPVRGLTFLGNNDRSFVLYCKADKRILKISMERFTLRTSTPRSQGKQEGRDCGKRAAMNP